MVTCAEIFKHSCPVYNIVHDLDTDLNTRCLYMYSGIKSSEVVSNSSREGSAPVWKAQEDAQRDIKAIIAVAYSCGIIMKIQFITQD